MLRAIFTSREWLQLNDLVFILQPFHEATVLIQAENSPTISLVVPTVLSLRRHLSNCSKRNLKCPKAIVDELLRSLNSRFEGIFEMLKGGSCMKICIRFYSAGRSDIKKPFEDFVYLVSATLDPRFGFQRLMDVNVSDSGKDLIRSKVKGTSSLTLNSTSG